MTRVKVKGGYNIRLHAPERRKLDDAAMVLRQIAVGLDEDSAAGLNLLAKSVEDTATEYSPKPGEPKDEPAKKK